MLVDERAHQRQDLAADRRVEADATGSSASSSCGPSAIAAGDQHALTLPARHLVRVAPEVPLGRAQAGTGQRVGHQRRLVARRPCGCAAPRRPPRRSCGAGSTRRTDPGRSSAPGAGTCRRPTSRAADRRAVEHDRALAESARGRGSSGSTWSCRNPTRRRAPGPRRDARRGRRRRRRAPAPRRPPNVTCSVADDERSVGCRAGQPTVARRAQSSNGLTCTHAARRPALAAHQLDVDRSALVDRAVAARVERATRRQVGRIGRIAGEPAAGSCATPGRRSSGTPAPAPGCTGAAGRRTPPCWALLDDPPGVHDRQPPARRSVSTDRSWVMNSIARPWSRCSSASSSSTWACTITSSAVVGSSAMSSLGSHASASAISTRWRCPPDSWCGYARGPRRRDADPLEQLADACLGARRGSIVGVQQDRLLDLARRRDAPGSASAARPGTRSPRWSSAPRAAARASSGRRPRRRAAPARRPACPSAAAAARRLAMVDLPQPDSPARPTVSPGSIVRSTPRTAGTGPPSVR